MDIVERFLKYVSFCTTSDEETRLTPSTPGQMVFAEYLRDELTELGLQDVDLDKNGYLMATLPATKSYDGSQAGQKAVPTIGFIAHMDTSPDASGKHVKPQLIKNYNGEDILLNEEKAIVFETDKYPEILKYKGQDILMTDGTTLLGADDKAGIAEIVSACEYLLAHPEIEHGKIRIGFTPDEEIGEGADHFDVEKFGCQFAYTMDGGEIGELEYENFNAASAKVTVKGVNVHPGYAKHKMLNSMRIAMQFQDMLPRHETPEHTEEYEGFYHLTSITGTVEETQMSYIIRDHNRERFESRKTEMQHLCNKINKEYGSGICQVDIKDQYYNMREKIEDQMYVVDLALEGMLLAGVTPEVRPIRGGTDGARLSFEGLPCPNIFAGGVNFHSRYEYLPVKSLEAGRDVIVKMVELLTKK